jgi:hypothetical protein
MCVYARAMWMAAPHARRCCQAMRVIRTGGTYIILPGGEGGSVSKHPKAGVKQINFGLTTSTHHSQLDTLAQLFDAGKLHAHLYAQVSTAVLLY